MIYTYTFSAKSTDCLCLKEHIQMHIRYNNTHKQSNVTVKHTTVHTEQEWWTAKTKTCQTKWK